MTSKHTYYSYTYVFVALCAFVLALGASMPGAAADSNPRYASIVMDADTGQILHERHADKILHPASLTKAMTLMLVFEEMRAGRLSKGDRIYVSKHAASMIPSKLGLKPGESIKVEDAIYALVTKSANDIAVALGEKVGGSEDQFARQMTNKAREIGMSRTIFKNASGLHHEGQITTARDMAKMALYMIRNYPEEYKYFSKQSFTYQGRTYANHNRLMETYAGMDGLKTGFIQASGFNLVASAVRGDHRLIGVVFGGRTSHSRNAHMKELLDRGFEQVGNVYVAKADTNVISVPVVSAEPAAYASAPPSPPPVPGRKPSAAYAVAALTKIAPATGLISSSSPSGPQYQWIQLSKLIGEGDSDPEMTDRIEASGMVEPDGQRVRVPATRFDESDESFKMASAYSPALAVNPENSWSIQVGAFSSRAKTDTILHAASQKLPERLRSKPAIAPLKTEDGWLFRARLSGYSEDDARRACGYLRDCLIIPPVN